GNAIAEKTDTWITSFQNYSGTTSSDPRLGHVLQGAGAPVQLADIHFTDGDGFPNWGYTFTLAPGETKIIMNFAVVQPTKAAAAANPAQLSALLTNGLACTTGPEQQETANFISGVPTAQIPALNKAGLIALILGLALAAMKLLLRRRPAPPAPLQSP